MSLLALELEFTLFEEGFFTVSALIMPEDPALRYDFIGEPTAEGMTAHEFVDQMNRTRFPKSATFSFWVLVKGRRRRVTVPLPQWPSSRGGYVIRTARFTGDLVL